jgi:hypothetical protein
MGSPGALRVGKFARYLSEFGWSAQVLTPQGAYTRGSHDRPDGVPVISTLYFGGLEAVAATATKSKSSVLGPFARGLKALMYPDRLALWYPFAVAAGRELLAGASFQAIYSSSPSVVNHLVAMKLAREFSLPWIADFRDLWTVGTHYSAVGIRRKLDTRLERRIIDGASRILVVSQNNADDLVRAYPAATAKVCLIRNGFDPARFTGGSETRSVSSGH